MYKLLSLLVLVQVAVGDMGSTGAPSVHNHDGMGMGGNPVTTSSPITGTTATDEPTTNFATTDEPTTEMPSVHDHSAKGGKGGKGGSDAATTAAPLTFSFGNLESSGATAANSHVSAGLISGVIFAVGLVGAMIFRKKETEEYAPLLGVEERV